MADLNKVFLMGNLTFDPEVRRTPNGTSVVDLRLAIKRVWTDKSSQRHDDVTYLDVTVWGASAENCGKYLKKGSGVHVEGSLKVDSWEDKNSGEKRTKLKVVADRVQFLGGRGDGGGGGGGGYSSSASGAEDIVDESSGGAYPPPHKEYGGGAYNNGGGGRGGATRRPAPGSRPAPPEDLPDPDDDDIPF